MNKINFDNKTHQALDTNNNFNLVGLPREIIEKIFLGLSSQDRIQGRSICKHLFTSLHFDSVMLPIIIKLSNLKSINSKCSESKFAHNYYRHNKFIINLLGGLEKYEQIPFLPFLGICSISQEPEQLPAPIVGDRSFDSKIVFRHSGNFEPDSVHVGYISHGEHGGWFIDFGGDYPSLKQIKDGRFLNEIDPDREVISKIKNPIQTLKKLFNERKTKITIRDKEYDIALV